MKLLIADDAKAFLDLERTFLRRADCQVLTALTGLEAIKVARNAHPDLIVLDVEMPEMTGIEAARILSSAPELKSIPIVICSSTNRKEEALAAGAKEFVSKPLDEEQFLAVIQRHAPLKVRQDARKTLSRPGTFLCKDVAAICTVHDVSASGVFIKTEHPLKIGDVLTVRFPLPVPEGVKEIQAVGHIVRATPLGYGLGFSDLSEGARLFLNEFIS